MLGKDGTTVQAIFIINQHFLKEYESKLMEEIYSKLDKKYCFIPSVTIYLTPIKVTKIVYFKYIHTNNYDDLLANLGVGFCESYIKMLDKAFKLHNHLNTIKNEVRWFYYSNIYTYTFSYVNLFRNGEKMRTIRNVKKPYGLPIPTQKQLESLLIPQIFKNRLELLNEFIGWKKEQNIPQIPHALPYPTLITDFLQFFMFYKYHKYWRLEKEHWYSNPKVFKINEFLSLRLEKGKTNIYVNGKKFSQCKFLLFNIPNKERAKYKDIDSIDEASELYDTTHETDHSYLNPETEFWGHCSNLQAWYENDYDTRILHSNLAFPLLKKLTKQGDPLAKKVFKEEIISRLESEYPLVFRYLALNHYLDNFTKEELKIISRNLSHPILKIFLRHYFSFKPHGGQIIGDGIQDIFIGSPDLFVIKKSIPDKHDYQKKTINLSDWKTSLKDILIYDDDKHYYRFLYYSQGKNPIEGRVRKDLIDLSLEILGKNSKCVISLLRIETFPIQIEFFNIKKKIKIYLCLEGTKER